MRRGLRVLCCTAAIAGAAAAAALAHERLRVSTNQNPLYWPSPSAISIVINSTGSDDVPDQSDEVALRMAIEDWNAVAGSGLALVEDASPAQQARTDFEDDDLHLILFDESNDSGYFGSGGIVAITPVWFYTSGQIADADVIFNGAEFMFTTSKQPGRFDLGSVGAHELGHLLGLDHSGWASATMYPYVDPSVVMQRSLSSDEVTGARAIAPSSTFGRITGTVRRAGDATPVAGAHVVAVGADGRTAASVLASASGAFTLLGLEGGDYAIYADPLDGPVTAANLGAGHVIETDFATTFGPPVSVGAGATVDAGAIDVAPEGVLSLGSVFDTYPLRVVQGAMVNLEVRGIGLFAGCTLTASDPDLVLGNVQWHGNSVEFQVTVPAAEPLGHVDLYVSGGGETAALTAALEVGPPDPTVTAVAPGSGAAAGGTALTLTGTNFRPGARVVIGDRVYRDGEPGGCTVVNPTTIALTTLATLPGEHDAVVIDASGVEGRLMDAYLAAATPSVASVFPGAGAAAGGTEVLIQGQSFAAGLTVRIGGVEQAATLIDSSCVRVVTAGGAAGGPYLLEVENPGGGLATAAFSYAPKADPLLAGAAPNEGATSGGTTITLTGVNLSPDVEVLFDADPITGLGGTPAASVTWIDAATLSVVTPPHPKGTVTILARDPATGQAALCAEGFSYASSGGGGGGGCFVRPLDRGPTTPGEALLGSWWVLLLLGWTLATRRRAPARQAIRA